MQPLRFHWSMSAAGDPDRATKSRSAASGIPNIDAHIEFCRIAEQCGIEYLLTAFGFHRPDAMALAGFAEVVVLVAVAGQLIG